MFSKMDKEQAYDGNTKTVAGIELTKVVREFVPIIADDNGGTFGNVLDEVLQQAAMNGEEIQTFALQFEKEDWQRFATMVRDSGASIRPRRK